MYMGKCKGLYRIFAYRSKLEKKTLQDDYLIYVKLAVGFWC